MRFIWDEPSIETAIAIARDSSSIEEAVTRCSKEFGVSVSRSALDSVFERNEIGTLYSVIRQGMREKKARQSITEQKVEKPPRVDATPTIPEMRAPTEEEIAEVEREAERLEEERATHDRETHGLREEIRELLAAKKFLLKELARRDAMLGIAEELHRAPPAIYAPEGRGEGKRRLGVPVMLLSDWHVEEPVDPKKVNGLNEYNLDIAETCIRRCAEAFEWLTRDPRYEMHEAVIWFGGDLFSGYIHEELLEQNFLSPVQAVVWLLDKLERLLLEVLATTAFERVIVVCNDGNHGRITNKIRVGTRTENSLEWLLYKALAQRFAHEPRLEFHVADGEYSYLDVYGQTLCFFHGDSTRYVGGVGGLLIPMKRGLNDLRKYKKVDQFCFGHFHQRLDLPNLSGNGSMIGINPYAMRNKFEPEPRQQSFFVLDSVRGKCLSAPIWLPDTSQGK